MIVEFYGTPGAGKTYLANAIVSQLKTEGVYAENVVDLGRSKTKNKAINKTIRVYLKIIPRYKKLKTDLCEVMQKYRNTAAKYNDEPIEGFLDNIVYYSFWYEKLRCKKGVYLFDEGISHQYVNMMANYGVSLNDVIEIKGLVPYLPPIIYVACESMVNFESIQLRNRHVCYIDELTGDELEACIREYRKACENILETVSPLVIKREDNIQYNIRLIREAVGI